MPLTPPFGAGAGASCTPRRGHVGEGSTDGRERKGEAVHLSPRRSAAAGPPLGSRRVEFYSCSGVSRDRTRGLRDMG